MAGPSSPSLQPTGWLVSIPSNLTGADCRRIGDIQTSHWIIQSMRRSRRFGIFEMHACRFLRT